MGSVPTFGSPSTTWDPLISTSDIAKPRCTSQGRTQVHPQRNKKGHEYRTLQNTKIINVTQIPIKGSCTPASQADFVAVAMTSILRMRTASESSWGNASKRMLK